MSALLPASSLATCDLVSQLLLGVHRDHGLAGTGVLGDLGCQVTELRVPVGMLITLGNLGVALQADPSDASIRATVRSETGCPTAVNAPARLRVDLVVHTNNDIGSPRVSGSTNAFSRASSPGSDSDSFLRPPPGPRTRTAGSGSPASSRTPRATVSGWDPVAFATILIPPRPSSAAYEPNIRRRCRSSRCGRSTAYLRPTDSATPTQGPDPLSCKRRR